MKLKLPDRALPDRPRESSSSESSRDRAVDFGVNAIQQSQWLIVSSLGHAFRKNAAGAFGPDLARKLSQLVKMEKNAMRSMELVARERMEVAVCAPLLAFYESK